MAESQLQKDAEQVSRSKSVPWFQNKLGSSLTPGSREVFEKYSGIDPSKVDDHIFKIRDEAWEVFPWPCVGEFWFVNLGLSMHPSYDSLLNRLKNKSQPSRLLDLGTCMGQDLRKLAFDGAPVEHLYGADIFPQYESIGHNLFKDADKFKGRFIMGDLLADGDNELLKTAGTWDVINIIMFLHIYDWKTQVESSRRILKLLSKKKGSMIIGVQTASIAPGDHVLKPPFVPEGQTKTIFRQSQETFVDMWETVAKEEKVALNIKAEYDNQEDLETRMKEEASGDKKRFFSGAEQRRLFFTIEVK